MLTGLLEAEPGAAELRRLWCDCANDLAWLWANHPDPARRDPVPPWRWPAGWWKSAPTPRPTGTRWGSPTTAPATTTAAVAALDRATALGGGTAFDDVFLAMAHARLGDPEEARQALARAIVRAERDYPGHPELAGFCDEARSILAGNAAAPLAIH